MAGIPDAKRTRSRAQSRPAPSASPGDAPPATLDLRIAAALREQREHLHLTQEQVAEEARVSLKYLGEVERGEANPTVRMLARLARALQWDPVTLLGRAPFPIGEPLRLVLTGELRALRRSMRGALRDLKALQQLMAVLAVTSDVEARVAEAQAIAFRNRRRRGRPPGRRLRSLVEAAKTTAGKNR